MQLRIGDRIVDESREWQVLTRTYTTGGGEIVNAHLQRVESDGPAREWPTSSCVAMLGAL